MQYNVYNNHVTKTSKISIFRNQRASLLTVLAVKSDIGGLRICLHLLYYLGKMNFKL